MPEFLSDITFLGIVMGFLATLIGFSAFFFGINSMKWILHKDVPNDAVGFGLTIGVAAFVAGIAWPIFLYTQNYRVVATIIFLSQLFYVFYRFGGRTSRS